MSDLNKNIQEGSEVQSANESDTEVSHSFESNPSQLVKGVSLKLKDFFSKIRGNKRNLTFSLLILFFTLAFLANTLYSKLLNNNLKKSELAKASRTYYLNFPVNDPLRIKINGLSENQLKGALAITPDIEFNLVKRNEYFEITPKNGLWPRSTRFKVDLSPNLLLKSKLLKKPVRIEKSFSFTTAGAFQVSQSVRGTSVNPSDGLEVRFNYRLKDPNSLKDKVKAVPQIALEVRREESVSEKEVGMVYRISSSEMKYDQGYEFTFDSSLLSELDETLGQEVKIIASTIANPNLPSIKVASGYYEYTLVVIPRGKNINIPIQASKTDEVDIKLYQITPAQAINFLVYKEPEADAYWSRVITRDIDLTGSVVRWEKNVSVNDLGKSVDIGKMPVGVYLLNLTAVGGGDVKEHRLLINVTDIGAVGVVGKFQNAFWMSSLTDGSTLSDANLRLYNLKDGANQRESVFSGADGLVKIPNSGKSDMAVAFYGEDVAFIPLAEPGSQMGLASSEGSYWWWSDVYPENKVQDLAYLYTDRPIYKPGDVIHAKAIVRRDRDSQYTAVEGGAYKLVLKKATYNPDQKPVWENEYSTNSLGTLSTDIELSEEFKTGYYHLSLEKDQTPVSTIGIYIDEYRKPLYEITLKTDSREIMGDSKLKFSVKSVYSFGMPVKDKDVEWSLYASDYYDNDNTADDPYQKSRENYFWEWWYDTYTYYGRDLAKGTARLNTDGEAVVEVDLDPSKFNFRKQRLTIEVKQVDEQVSPERAFTQLSYLPNTYEGRVVGRGDVLEDPFIVFELKDLQGKPVADAEVKLLSGTDEIGKQKTKNDGQINFKLNKEKIARGELTFSWKDKDDNEQHLYTYYYTYSSIDEIDSLSFPTHEAQVNLTQDVKYGDTVNLKVEGGGEKHLVVLGRESVIDAFVVDDAKNTEFEITDELMPNSYLFTYSFKDGAFIKAEKSIEPSGLKDFKRINISLNLDKGNYKPGEEVTLEIKTTDKDGTPVSSEVSVGVIDKAIYQLKKKAEKPIHPYFYKKRFSQNLVSESLSGIKLFAGDGMGGGGGPEATVRSNFVDTAYYKPDVVTDSQGIAKVTFKLPDNITTWLISSYAVNSETFVGEAEKEFLATKDVFAIPVFPQFVTTGDNVWFRSLIGNSGGNERKVNASFAFGGKAPGKNPTQTLGIPAGSTRMTQWEYKINETGKDAESALLVAEKENVILDGVTLKTPIHSQGVTITSRTSGIGSSKVKAEILSGANSQKTKTSLYLHSSILGYINDILSYQAGYPYGCVEQTMSKFYPTLLVKKYVNYLTIQDTNVMKNLDDMVKKGLERLQKFQHEDGGWGLWENDSSSPYYTTYVLSGLLDLQGSYKIPEGMLEGGKKYLEDQITQGKLSDKDKAKAIVPLAIMGSSVIDISDISFPNLTDLDDQQMAETAIAYATFSLKDESLVIDELKKRAISVGDQAVKWNSGKDSGHFAHENLTTGLAIQALLIAEPSSELIPKALNYLNSHRNMYVYGSTYTNAQVAKAFVEYVRLRGLSGSSSEVTVTQEGKTIFNGALSGSEDSKGPIEVIPGKELSINQAGSGALLWELVTENTFSGKLQNRESEDFKIERVYKNLTRKDGSYKVGDLIEVNLKVTGKSSNLSNLVIEDKLPAGLEAVNPKLDNESHMYDRYYDPNSTERYSDHVVMFPSYISSGGNYTYLARAFLPGTYIANPATVSLMYTPAVPAFSSTLELTINE